MAATFGAGLGYACVVDVGDQKTSVSCVEDGISHPATRVSDFEYIIAMTKDDEHGIYYNIVAGSTRIWRR